MLEKDLGRDMYLEGGGGRSIICEVSLPIVISSAKVCSEDGEQINSSLVNKLRERASRHFL